MVVYFCVLCNEFHEKDDKSVLFLTGFRKTSCYTSMVGFCSREEKSK